MENLGFLTWKRVFTQEQAQALLPVIARVTGRAQKEIQHLSNLLPASKSATNSQYEVIQQKIETLLGQWQDHVRRLGAEPKGFWNVDFDNGEGYFCWKYPEPQIRYWHRYQDGFPGRVEISAKHNCCDDHKHEESTANATPL